MDASLQNATAINPLRWQTAFSSAARSQSIGQKSGLKTIDKKTQILFVHE